jgi:nicotinamidase-related amidase
VVESALVIVDMQRDVMLSCPEAEPVLTTVNGLIRAARQIGAPIVFIRHHDEDMPVGSTAWEIDDRLDHDDGDIIVDKAFRDGFADTDLDGVLRGFRARRLVITGAHSDFCVQTTALSALAYGYDITLVADGHAAEPTIIAGAPLDAATITAFVNARMTTLKYPNRRVEVLPATHVAFA